MMKTTTDIKHNLETAYLTSTYTSTYTLMCQSAYAAGRLEGILKAYIAAGDMPGVKVTDRVALRKYIDEKVAECYALAKAKYPVN